MTKLSYSFDGCHCMFLCRFYIMDRLEAGLTLIQIIFVIVEQERIFSRKGNIMNTQENLIQFGKQWDQAIVDNDAEKVGKFMSSDWVIVATNGGITSKASFLDSIRSGDLVHTKMDFEDIRVKLYGNTGVVTSRGTSSGFYKGHPFSFFEWSMNVYILEEKKWHCVLTMLTAAKP